MNLIWVTVLLGGRGVSQASDRARREAARLAGGGNSASGGGGGGVSTNDTLLNGGK